MSATKQSYKRRMEDYRHDSLDYQQAMAKYKQDARSNCANYGYYMYKHVEGAQTDSEEYLGQTITLRGDNPDHRAVSPASPSHPQRLDRRAPALAALPL